MEVIGLVVLTTVSTRIHAGFKGTFVYSCGYKQILNKIKNMNTLLLKTSPDSCHTVLVINGFITFFIMTLLFQDWEHNLLKNSMPIRERIIGLL